MLMQKRREDCLSLLTPSRLILCWGWFYYVSLPLPGVFPHLSPFSVTRFLFRSYIIPPCVLNFLLAFVLSVSVALPFAALVSYIVHTSFLSWFPSSLSPSFVLGSCCLYHSYIISFLPSESLSLKFLSLTSARDSCVLSFLHYCFSACWNPAMVSSLHASLPLVLSWKEIVDLWAGDK